MAEKVTINKILKIPKDENLEFGISFFVTFMPVVANS